MKRCSKCKEVKPFSEFNKNRNNKDGLRFCCKECKMIIDKKYRQTHKKELRQYALQYQKQYFKTIQGHLCRVWHNMLNRCNNPKRSDYKYYGGQGIKVKFNTFTDFSSYVVNVLKSDPRGLTIDRIDNNGDYEVDNIRFVTRAENNRNKRKRYALKA
ncbi:hypothetical protein LCGC14_2596430 [marine sediment metagenome]|uniref:HNH endonuclease n=1 Tax=marine sediment metagenome TaxID=412755 RepID=A0A0F9D2S1_9ZZZZ